MENLDLNKEEINTNKIKQEIKEELLKNQIMMGLQQEDDDEIDLFEFLKVLKGYWKQIIIIPTVVAVLVAIYTLTMPNFFKSQGTIYVHSSGGGELSSLMNSLPIAGLLGAGGSGGNAGYLKAFLQSEAMNLHIIREFGIATNPAIVGDVAPDPTKPISIDKLIKKMSTIAKVEDDVKSGLITISAETMNATTSCDIVKAYINRLKTFAKGPQKEKRIFVEQQLAKVGKELEAAENELKVYQDKYKIYSLEKQTEAAVTKMSNLEAQRVTSNVLLEMTKSTLKTSASMPDLVRMEAEKVAEEAKSKAINDEIASLEKSLSSMPDVALEYLRLKRNLMIKEKVYAVLIEQFEMAKISEAEEGSQFEVLDEPRIADTKSKPSRAVIVLGAGCGTGFLVVLIIFLMQYVLPELKKAQKANQEMK